MAWIEPLSVATVDHDEYTFTCTVKENRGRAVAHVKCAVNVPAGCGVFGALFIDDTTGGVRQKIRALCLLTREALRHAHGLGIVTVETTLPPRLRKFAETLSGKTGAALNTSDGRLLIRGGLAEMLANAEAKVQTNGDVPSITVGDVTL